MTALEAPVCTGHCDGEVPRDRWGRPVIDDHPPFTRVSTVAKALDDQSNLIGWKAGQMLYAASLPESSDLREEALLAHGDRRRMRSLVDAASSRVGLDGAARRGTALHDAVSISVLTGEYPPHLSDQARRSLDVFWDVLARTRLRPIASEVFVADTDRAVAGTFDLLLRDDDGTTYVADVKTGAKSWERQFPHAVAVQLAAYQAGTPWCPLHGWRPKPATSDHVGILVSLPIDTGLCYLDDVDLEAGAHALDLALAVRDWRSRKGIATERAVAS